MPGTGGGALISVVVWEEGEEEGESCGLEPNRQAKQLHMLKLFGGDSGEERNEDEEGQGQRSALFELVSRVSDVGGV